MFADLYSQNINLAVSMAMDLTWIIWTVEHYTVFPVSDFGVEHFDHNSS